jgi:hypothetical protein
LTVQQLPYPTVLPETDAETATPDTDRATAERRAAIRREVREDMVVSLS